MTKKHVITILLLLFCWRVILLDLAILGSLILPFKTSFPYANLMASMYPYANFFIRWANFDGVHYLTIAREGYANRLGMQAFFPMYPRLLMGAVEDIMRKSEWLFWAGMFVSHVSFISSVLVFFQLLKKKFNERIAFGSVVTLLLFPTSLFFGAVYTESLFLLLVLLAFWSAEQKRWLWAGIFTAVASATRLVGIFLIPALILALTDPYIPKNWTQVRSHKLFKSLKKMLQEQWKGILAILIGVLGLVAYMAYLQVTYHNPLLFVTVQSDFGAGRSTHFVLYPQVVWRAIKILITTPIDLRYITSLQEFLAGTLGLVGIWWARKYVPLSWTLFALLCFFLPPLTGTFSSMSRYILVCFPLFILGGKLFERKPKLAYLVWFVSFLLLAINTVLFIQGYWVA